jgi:hypothetical protein
MNATETRERIFILAASKEQAALFARRWVAEGEGRRLQDAIYLHDRASFDGHFVLPTDRVVGVEGYWRHPRSDYIERCLRRTLAKTARSLNIEPVAIS